MLKNPIVIYKATHHLTWDGVGKDIGLTRQRCQQLSKIHPKDVMALPLRTIQACFNVGIGWVEWLDEYNKLKNK